MNVAGIKALAGSTNERAEPCISFTIMSKTGGKVSQ